MNKDDYKDIYLRENGKTLWFVRYAPSGDSTLARCIHLTPYLPLTESSLDVLRMVNPSFNTDKETINAILLVWERYSGPLADCAYIVDIDGSVT